MKFTPHAYQEKAIKFFVERPCAGAFLEPGLGKTSITLAALDILKRKGFVKRTLIIAPLRVCYSVWPREVEKWDEFNHISVGVLHGKDKAKVLRERHDIYVINPEGLNWLLTQTRGDWPFDTLVVDESSKFKHTNTHRFKTLKNVLPKFNRRYILTGSPATNSMLDLFGQVYIMDLGATFGPYVTHFRNEYFFQTGYGGYTWVPKPRAEKRIHQELAPRIIRLDAKDYIKLPPLIEDTVVVDLPDVVKAAYQQFEERLRLDFESGKVIAVNAAVATMKCQQIANGGIYLNSETERTWENMHDAKTEAVVDLVEELEGQPTLIAYNFQHDLDRLKKALGKDVPVIGGGVSAKRSDEIVDAWNRGSIPVLLGHPQAMGHGLNMQGAGRAVIWHSLTWDYEVYDQFIRRVWRQGQKGRVFLYHIVARDTIDEAIMTALSRKKKGQQVLLDALRDYWKKR